MLIMSNIDVHGTIKYCFVIADLLNTEMHEDFEFEARAYSERNIII